MQYTIYSLLLGAELGITSDGFFDLKSQPSKVVVVGAGYIAVEMAQGTYKIVTIMGGIQPVSYKRFFWCTLF